MSTTYIPGTPEYHTQKAMQSRLWSQNLLEQDFVIIDFETTGLYGEPMQIAVIDRQGQTLLSTLVCPLKFDIYPKAVAIHGITEEAVVNAPVFTEIYTELRTALEGRPVVAYNAKFDKSVLERTCKAYGLDMIKSNPEKWYDPMFQYAAFKGNWDSYHQSYKWPKLTEAIEDFNLTLSGKAHDALTDVQITLRLIQSMSWENNYEYRR